MTDLRKAAEMALEALTKIIKVNAMGYEYKKWAEEAHETLRQALEQPDSSCNGMPAYEGSLSKSQALAQPEQEPVAWINGYGFWKYKPKDLDDLTPLYTAPPKREWVGLTYDEIYEFVCTTDSYKDFGKAIEAKLKEKNT